MDFEYINENLEAVIDNPDKVMYIKPYSMGNKSALFAVLKEDDGIYKRLQLTKAQSKLHFPIEPIFNFYRGPGYFYLKNFTVFDNMVALNINYFDGFKCKYMQGQKYFNLGVFALFNDGTATYIAGDNDRKFLHTGGFKKFYNLLDPRVACSEKDDTYEIIESYRDGDNDTFIIPSLQKENSHIKPKTLVKSAANQV